MTGGNIEFWPLNYIPEQFGWRAQCEQREL